MKGNMANGLVRGLASIGQGAAGFFLAVSSTVSVVFILFGGWAGVLESAAVGSVSGFLLYGTVRKFGLWKPAVVGTVVGVVISALYLLWLLFLIAIVFGAAAAGGQ